jgi:hypothetical protein
MIVIRVEMLQHFQVDSYGNDLLLIVWEKESSGAAVGFGDDPWLAFGRVIGGHQSIAVVQREVILGFVFCTNVGPIALQMALETPSSRRPAEPTPGGRHGNDASGFEQHGKLSFLGKQIERLLPEGKRRLDG